MYVFTTFINIIFTYYLYKQGRAGPWPPIQSLPAQQFRFFGLGREGLNCFLNHPTSSLSL